jgi:hypothetical protein
VDLIHRIEPAEAILHRMVSEAEQHLRQAPAFTAAG